MILVEIQERTLRKLGHGTTLSNFTLQKNMCAAAEVANRFRAYLEQFG